MDPWWHLIPTYIMLNIVTWNVKGLKSPQKRGMILRHLKKLHTDIALLQETHLLQADFPRMRKLWVGDVVGSPAIGRKAGTRIMIRKGLHVTLLSTERDTKGRRVSVLLEEGGNTFRITYLCPQLPLHYIFSRACSMDGTAYAATSLHSWWFQLRCTGSWGQIESIR